MVMPDGSLVVGFKETPCLELVVCHECKRNVAFDSNDKITHLECPFCFALNAVEDLVKSLESKEVSIKSCKGC